MTDFKLNFIHLCDEALFSQDGKLSLIGIFEVINVANLPGTLLKASLVFNMNVLNKNLDKVELDIIVRKSDTKEEIFKLPTLTPSFPKNQKDNNKIGVNLQLVNIQFKYEGQYMLELLANKEIVGSLDFQVNLLKQNKEGVN